MQLHELLAFFIYSDALMECVCGKQRAYHSMAPDTWAMCMSLVLQNKSRWLDICAIAVSYTHLTLPTNREV